jgi:hypothetical protein
MRFYMSKENNEHLDLDATEKTINTQRIRRLSFAELFDAWRLFPRGLVIMYMILVAFVVDQFFKVATITKIECNADLMTKLVALHVPIAQAQAAACHAVDIVGGPTTTHTILVTTICGLSAAIFGLYTGSGRDWTKGAFPWVFRQVKQEKDCDKEKEKDSNESQ